MRKAREMLVAMEGCEHIMHFGCALHSFNLVMGSCVAHPWARHVATDNQKIVSYFCASSKATAALARTATTINVQQRTLLSSNKTRFTSTLLSIESVLSMEMPLRVLALSSPGIITNAEVLALIRDQEFWHKLRLLCKVLKPFGVALTAIQSREARLADVSRHFVYLAQALRSVLPELPTEYAKALVVAYNARVAEMHTGICRLALFLDPRYKAAADADSKTQGLLLTAATIMQRRGYSPEAVTNLTTQLLAYKVGDGAFAKAFGGPGFNPRLWWASIASDSQEAVELYLLLDSIKPHATDAERTCSLMGWMKSAARNRLGVDTTGMMCAVNMHNAQHVPAPKRRAIDPAAAAASDAAGVARACSFVMVKELVEPAELDTELDQLFDQITADEATAAAAARVANAEDSFMSLLLEGLEGFNVGSEVLHPEYQSPQWQPQTMLPVLRAYTGGSYSVEDLVQASMQGHAQRRAQQMYAAQLGPALPQAVIFGPGCRPSSMPQQSGLVMSAALQPGTAPLQPGTTPLHPGAGLGPGAGRAQ